MAPERWLWRSPPFGISRRNGNRRAGLWRMALNRRIVAASAADGIGTARCADSESANANDRHATCRARLRPRRRIVAPELDRTSAHPRARRRRYGERHHLRLAAVGARREDHAV